MAKMKQIHDFAVKWRGKFRGLLCADFDNKCSDSSDHVQETAGMDDLLTLMGTASRIL